MVLAWCEHPADERSLLGGVKECNHELIPLSLVVTSMLLPLELTQTECSVEVHIVADLLQHSLKGRVAVDVFHRATGTKTDKTICRYDSSLSRRRVAANQLCQRMQGGLTKLVCVVWIGAQTSHHSSPRGLARDPVEIGATCHESTSLSFEAGERRSCGLSQVQNERFVEIVDGLRLWRLRDQQI